MVKLEQVSSNTFGIQTKLPVHNKALRVLNITARYNRGGADVNQPKTETCTKPSVIPTEDLDL